MNLRQIKPEDVQYIVADATNKPGHVRVGCHLIGFASVRAYQWFTNDQWLNANNTCRLQLADALQDRLRAVVSLLEKYLMP